MFRKTSLSLIFNNKNQLLLCMKKRWLWEWKFNWPWGKPRDWEDIRDTAVRETFEETGLDISWNLKQVWVLYFDYKDKPEWNTKTHLFLSKNVTQIPVETEEMKPYFFDIDDIPYDKMWDDDSVWMPRILVWERDIEYNFYFDKNSKLEKYELIK